MKVKNVNLVWNVLRHSSMNDTITNFNIFYSTFPEDIRSEIKRRRISNYEELKNYIKQWGMYNYWSRAEHEILVSGLFSDIEHAEKIDVWRQIEMNLDRIVEYISKEMEINFDKKGNIVNGCENKNKKES